MSKKKIEFPKKSIFLCQGSSCKEEGNKDLAKHLKHFIKENHLKNSCGVFKLGCIGKCKHAPIMSLQPKNQWFSNISEKDAEKITEDFLMKEINTQKPL
jgi:NADH:ubiquinone oxidoreductase subunit E